MEKPLGRDATENMANAHTSGRNDVDAAKDKKINIMSVGRVLLILLVVLLSLFLLSRSPLFCISEIEVTGIQYYNESQIIDKSGLSIGQNGFEILGLGSIEGILTFRCLEVEKEISDACPYIKKVYAKFKMPDRIVIDVEERSKLVVVPYQDVGLLLDEDGYVIDAMKNYQGTGLPVVKGMTFEGYNLGSKLATDSDLYIDAVIAIISALRQSDRDTIEKLSYMVESIDVGDLKNIKLFINNEFVVNIGDGSDIYYRISALKEIYYNGLTNGERGLIDFSRGNKPFFEPEHA